MKKICLFLSLTLLIAVLSGCTDSKGEWGQFGRNYTKTIEKFEKSSAINQKVTFVLKMDYAKAFDIKNDKNSKKIYNYFVKDNKITATMDCIVDRKNEIALFKVSAGKLSNLQFWLTKSDIYVSTEQFVDLVSVFADVDLSAAKVNLKDSFLSLSSMAPEISAEIEEILPQLFEQMDVSYSTDYYKSGGKILKLMDTYKIIQATNKGLEKPALSVTKNNITVDVNYSNIKTLSKNLETFYSKNGQKFDKSLSKLMSDLMEKSLSTYDNESLYGSSTNPFDGETLILKELITSISQLDQVEKLKFKLNLSSDANSKFSLSGKIDNESLAMSVASTNKIAKSISLPKKMNIIDLKNLETIITLALYSAAA